jgi:PAS domain S-box-containing protein
MTQTFQPRQETLQASEERFRLLVDGVQDYAIVMLDVQGRIVGWNAGAAHLYGYRADEIMDHRVVCFYPTEAQHQNLPAHVLDVATTTGRWEDEGWRVRKDDP